MKRRLSLSVLLPLLLLVAMPSTPAAVVPAGHAKDMAAGLELFKNSVGGLLKEHCIECHGGAKTKGDFDLATREGLLKGGAEGVAVVPGKSAESRLVKMIAHTVEPHMPSKKPRLPETTIQQIAKWIDLGAPYAAPLIEGAKVVKDRSAVTAQDRAFWSFQPLRQVQAPAVKTSGWARTPVDQFILAKLEAKGIQPNASADRRVLIRRAYFDLIGLPPTPAEVDAFVNDSDPHAFAKLVDRLLASPHHGERWARHWLDLARFGESHGYEQDYDRPFAYHYRDFVIRALNADVPYDKFVQWQIAGDELDPDNPEAWFATGFLGAGTHATQITANQAEKERYDELDDIINTIGTSMLGLTVGCARCHDHKFDPIPSRDYYSMLATFTTTVRSDYSVPLNPAQTRAALAVWEREHTPLVKARESFEREQLPARFETWLKGNPALPSAEWLWLQLDGVKASGGYYGINKITAQPDGSQLLIITAGAPDTMRFTVKTQLTNITALRFEALADAALPAGGPGWGKDGGFQISEIQLTAKPLKGDGKPGSLAFARRIDADTGKVADAVLPWSGGNAGTNHVMIFPLTAPAGFAGGTELSFTLKCPDGFDRNMLGRLRVSATTLPEAPLAGSTVAAKDYELARAAFARERTTWKAPEREAALRIFRTTDADWRRLDVEVEQHASARPRPQLVKAMVCSEGLPAIRLHTQGPDFYEETFQLKRGDLAQKQGKAEPGFLQVLMRAPDPKRWLTEAPAEARTPQRRTAFARWITDVDQGAGQLLARVIVNRLWQHHFGRGIVATPSDFGATGAAPTHPELLDWLAGELIRNGWQLKPIHRLLMNSAVYQQATTTDARRLAADVDNSLWWHRKPTRLEAEIIRDNILAVSGTLDPRMFGPGSLDEGMTRRSIYFTVKRSKLIPMMVQFDWPDSLQGIGQRVNTTVAPQALLMMNNVHVRSAATKWAERLLAREKDSPQRVTTAYREALGRKPTAEESRDAQEFIAAQARSYAASSAATAEPLALADFCQTLFALNEFIYVE
jgi:mono/diheme cytochrome c family protein